MTRRPSVAPLALPLLAACGGPGAPPAPPRLGYDAVTEPAAVYVRGDTARVEVDAGGRTVEGTVSTAMTLDIRFRPSPEGVTVSASFRDVSARATNPMAAPRSTGTSAVDEPLVFALDRRGESTVVSSPDVGDPMARFLSPEALAATLFPRLPGRAVEVGHRWTDTVEVDAEGPETRVRATSIVRYTVVGDTAVGGRSLLQVALEAEDHREIAGTGDTAVRHTLDGGSTGWFLWDPFRGLLHESVRDSDLSGTMEVEGAPFPLSLRVRSRTELRLVDVPTGG